MSKYKVKEIDDKRLWEKVLLSQKPQSFLQSWNWGEVNDRIGENVIRVGFFCGDKVVGLCQLIHQGAKRGPHFIVPAGPVIDWKDEALVNCCVKFLKDIGVKENTWFIRIRPEVLDGNESRNIFLQRGFRRAPMHLHAENTWVLDIEPDEQSILSGMRKNTRYLVRKSLDMNFQFEQSDDAKDIKYLVDLQKETEERHGFVGFSEDLLKAQLDIFAKDDQASLYLVRHKKKVLVAAIIVYYGDCAFYHHSASGEEARKLPLSYFLQWNVIRQAKERGKKFYNFWGIAPEGAVNHRYTGVTTFKKGFGGHRVDWLPAQDLPVGKHYWATHVFERIRKKTRHL